MDHVQKKSEQYNGDNVLEFTHQIKKNILWGCWLIQKHDLPFRQGHLMVCVHGYNLHS